MRLQDSVTMLRGIGQQTAAALAAQGIETLGNLLWLFPREYVDLSASPSLRDAKPGDWVGVDAEVATQAEIRRRPGKPAMVSLMIDDGTAGAECVWFGGAWAASSLPKGTRKFFLGKLDYHGSKRTLVHPTTEPPQENDSPGIRPIYPAITGISPKKLRGWIAEALQGLDRLADDLPPRLREQLCLASLDNALRWVHVPRTLAEADAARKRLGFEEMLLFLVALRSARATREETVSCPKIETSPNVLAAFYHALGFAPTGAQRRVIEEVLEDMHKPKPMNRLVQGDVGCGKTAVALAALYAAAKEGWQGALMAPTELLAAQLYQNAQKLLGGLGLRVGLLTGSMSAAERKEAHVAVRDGTWDVTVGTHALIQKTVDFHRLGLVVADEQHRFGVAQRARLGQKGTNPHMLVMSATPVPRSLALILYGDLDLSAVDELPPGRIPVKTRIVAPEKRVDMYRFLAEEMEKGQQTYVVCPMIDASESLDAQSATELYNELRRGPFKKLPVGLVHGRQAAAEKERTLDAFRRGELRALVSTTVIEVGVHVETAGVMVVENAERFGLAQLHQLRGRVGRGGQEGWCFLVEGSASGRQRLQAMTETHNGFLLAQKDLNMRGPGEFLGKHQWGMDASAMALLKNPQGLEELTRIVDETLHNPEWASEKETLLALASTRYHGKLGDIAMN